jgi:hypothetical protein
MAVGFPSKVNFATGDVLSATNVNDISGTLNLVDGTQYSGGKNRVLNSAMQVAQRGTSFSLAASTAYTSGYTLDRWQTATGANQACTIARQATGDTTNLPNIQYCLRYQRNSGQTGTGILYTMQSFESLNSIPLAGKQVTFSFYARAGANYSAASSVLGAIVYSGTGTDQNGFTGLTGQTAVIAQNATLTTTWQRFTYTGTVASTATQLLVQFTFTPTGTASTNDYFEITGVQLEASTVASAFATNGATYQAELAACQRYYYRATAGSVYGTVAPIAWQANSSTSYVSVPLPVNMRIAPTSLDSGNIAFLNYSRGSVFTLSGVVLDATNGVQNIVAVGTITGGTAGTGGSWTGNNNAAGFLGFSAEL